MGAKDFFKNQTGLLPPQKGAVKDNLDDSLVDVESPAHTEEKFEEREYLLPDIDYSDPANFVRYGLAYEYYNNAFVRIQQQYPYDGSAAEQLAFYNDLTPLEKYVYDEKYPKYNGHVKLGVVPYNGDNENGFGSTESPQYIRFYGGPHEGNVVDANVGQENNLHLDLEDGLSVEFWLRKNGVAAASETDFESLLNIRNEADTQRFYIYIDRTQTSRIYYLHQNWNGASFDNILNDYFDLGSVNIADDVWRHLAFSFKKQSGASVKAVCYINGQQVDTNFNAVGAASPVYAITGSVVGTINAAGGGDDAAPATAKVNDEAGYGKAVSASYDEFRIWKTERNGKQIGLNWFRHVYGGTNTDKSKYYHKSSTDNKKIDLAVYFKFNEGIISSTGAGTFDAGNEVTSSTAIGDNLVVDYSGRISNGVFIGYDSTLGMRSEDSAMVLASASLSEEKDPLLFSENPDYSSALTPLLTSGSNHDVTNQTALYNSIPQWIRDDDLSNGSEVKKLLQVLGSYFDTMHAQIEHVKKFREAQYISSTNKTTDYVSSLLKAHGFNVPELFVDPDVLSSIFDQDEKRVFEEKLYNLKNKVYKNIYSNLIAIYKAKGTEKGFRNLFRCYGTDDELFKINLYADGVEYKIDDKTYDTLVKKRLVDFSGFTDIADRDAVIYQGTSVSGEYGFYPSSSNENIPFTIEAQIEFPNKPDIPSLVSIPLLHTASLFGVHSSSISNTDTTIPASGDCDFQVQTRRDKEGFAQFVLTSSTGFFPTLTSSFFYDEEKLVYDDIPWNLAVRIYPQEYPFSSYVTSSQNYILNFYGVKNYLGNTLAEFEVQETITHSSASQFLTGSNKRFFVGADREDVTGSVNNKSDVKFARFMVWNSFLTNDEIKKHNRNPKNYGLANPYHNAFTYESAAISASYIAKADTLALNWEFDTLTAYNGTSLDSTSGSAAEANKYLVDNFGVYNGQNYPGTLLGFQSSNDSTILELMQAEVVQRPDALYGKNFVRVRENDFESHETNKKPVKFFFAFEASQNEVISRDILNFFSDVVSFNNLYGEQVQQYRGKYKDLEAFKRFYFDKVDNVADLDKFVNLYKFLDNALDSVIKNLVPASAATSEKIRTIVEDHVLDRHKYKKPYEKLIQDFEEDVNKADLFPDAAFDRVPTKKADLDGTDIAEDSIKFVDFGLGAGITTTTLTPISITANRNAGVGLSSAGKRQIQINLRRAGEVTRLNTAASSGTRTRKYAYANLREEKDRGDAMVISEDVDTFRVQQDVYKKGREARQGSTPYYMTADKTELLGVDTRAEIDLSNYQARDTSTDGYAITLESFPLEHDYVSDIEDRAIYGAREYQVKLQTRNPSINTGFDYLPNEIRIFSSSTDTYSLNPQDDFEVEFIRNDSILASPGRKSLNKQLLVTDVTDRKEKFSFGLSVASSGDPLQAYVTNPQVTVNTAGSFAFDPAKPTNLAKEIETSVVVGYKNNYNWDGKSNRIIGRQPLEDDVLTLINNPTEIVYGVEVGSIFSFQFPGSGTPFPVHDRQPISRSVNANDDALYRVVDRGIFRDRTDVETEQLSPNANLNYKNLSIRRALTKAYSTPLNNQGSFYRSIGNDIGVPIYSTLPNPRLVNGPIYTQSYSLEYDNSYIQRLSQNNYNQRWYLNSNLVRLSETNNAPYINKEFTSEYEDRIGELGSYSPLTNTSYDSTETFTIPHDEESVAAAPFGTHFVDFLNTNIVVDREVNVAERSVNPTTNDYINPKLSSAPNASKKLHLYLASSAGPYQASLENKRLNHAKAILNSARYKGSFSYNFIDTFNYEDITRFDLSGISSKGRTNYVIVEKDGQLLEIKYELYYYRLSEFFSENGNRFTKLPTRLVKPLLEHKQNRDYVTIFGERGKELNNHTVKYFTFAEQIFPRQQIMIKDLNHYESDTNFFIDDRSRKTSTETNSLGRSFEDTAYVNNTGFSSWSTETSTITEGNPVTHNDGELVQVNYDEGYQEAGIPAHNGPYEDGYYNQTYGYRINHRNRNDSYAPRKTATPYKSYQEMVSSIVTDNPTMGAVVEYRSEGTMDSFLRGGCSDLSSEIGLFGYDFGSDSKKLLGLASYSDEIFELKDIHKQIDKF